MEKDFDTWNEKKKTIHLKNNTLYFKEAEVWWVHFGVNIGFEMDGKGIEFMRPVCIVKKYNQYSFLAIPLSTSSKENKYRIHIGLIDGKNAFVNLSQMKNIDSKRLINKIAHIERRVFKDIKEKASRVNFC
jgi:mRNA interferase MazF